MCSLDFTLREDFGMTRFRGYASLVVALAILLVLALAASADYAAGP
jgi:hypothetical protein